MTTSAQPLHFWSLVKQEWRTAPNLITIVRLVLVGVIIWLLVAPNVSWLLPFGVFVLVAASDWVDGYIAKRYSQVTQLGKIIDPLVDKVLIVGVLTTLTVQSAVSGMDGFATIIGACVLLITIREVGVLHIKRRAARVSKKVESAIQSGRISMATQCLATILLLTPLYSTLKTIVLLTAVLASYYSWWDYAKRS